MAPLRLLSPALLAAGILLTAGSAAAENATVPYAKLDELWQKIEQVDAGKLVASAQVVSKIKGIKPAQIRLVIRSTTGDIPLRVSAEGYILDFPRTEALRKENPPIEANQPKGSLRLNIGVELAVPPANSFPYARLTDGIAEAIKLMKAQASGPSPAEPAVRSVIFLFPKSGARKATVDVRAAGKKRVLSADANGLVRLPIESALAAENPEVKLSERPVRLFIDSE